ncbi:sigma-54 dependent transcriptional regulator [Geomonas sp. RF6]|uniref:sigma-54-dependent transcriptional regulator n=1 Tax=Geomonas sp. RF6 TaxID=2897342 RepID=UPI001E2C77CC|nr:sigma-54 dependent transcriptional regulator [Geomonas sp. RF6]UFS71931.1 sigma-54 dependent transcriptional regulator [Geomonas sp. RF6]
MTDLQRPGQLPAVLFVDDDADFLNEIRFVLLSNKLCNVVTLTDSSKVLSELESAPYSIVFMDWIMPGLSGADLLPVITQRFPSLPVIIMTGVNDVDTAVTCMKQGALDYVTKPLDSSRLLSCINSALRITELSAQNRLLQNYLMGEPVVCPGTFSEILSRSEKMQAIFKLIETIAPSRYPVIITGETGVGKELIARAVHKASGLTGSFVPLNVAGLSAHMFEDTLFGHNKGAFTGANERRDGLVKKAQGGTLFLDEIGDLSLESQIKLLRLLQENEYYRLGSDVLLKNEARIIVASNGDFSKMMEQGSFREDLYHRLCYHRLHIPPLRERREDILPLVTHYVEAAARNIGKHPPRISSELRFILEAYDYPGNVRELINKVSSAVVANQTGILTQNDFPEVIVKERAVNDLTQKPGNGQFNLHVVFPTFPSMEEVEMVMLEEALKATGGKKSAAADLLGVCRQTVQKKLAEMERRHQARA